MTKFFHINATLEVHRAHEDLRLSIDELFEVFPGAVHLRSQRALLEYHMRGQPIISSPLVGFQNLDYLTLHSIFSRL